ncbi:MAG TPA: efflux RND transporter periplasmic adaptor subunit [Bacteroidota bacterium]|nr:efflux RND transporter periplasmic adaptor subunit [Bacteroidota bacterium]
MKKKSKLLVSSAAVLVLVALALVFVVGSKDGDEETLPRVKVTRGTIVEKALAVGTVEPENEISIKSKVTGVVSRIFADAGTYVKAGQPLLEVRPDPTPLELADAKRNVELAEVELNTLRKERMRQESLVAKQLISNREYEDFQKRYDEADLRLKIAREKLALLESGRVRIGNKNIESIIKAPIDGYVLSKTVEVGDPVTPLTSFQEGTVLMKMANMNRLVFKGTVDEIDVGKLKQGMEAELKVGALPNDTVRGVLSKISLKAEKKDQATVFPIEIDIPKSNTRTLRAGYSANASIIIQRKQNVLIIPERVVTFRNDSAFVRVPVAGGTSEERFIKTGLSDAINIEVVSGLKEGDEVEEKPTKRIE